MKWIGAPVDREEDDRLVTTKHFVEETCERCGSTARTEEIDDEPRLKHVVDVCAHVDISGSKHRFGHELCVECRDALFTALESFMSKSDDRALLERLIDCVAQESHSVGISETMSPEERVKRMAREIQNLRSELGAATARIKSLEDGYRDDGLTDG